MNTIAKTALSNNKKNKVRSRLISTAVFLSTVLLTIICTYAYGLTKYEKVNAELKYGRSYGTFHNVSEAELEEIKRHSEFSETGVMTSAGMINWKKTVFCVAADQTARDFSNLEYSLKKGDFPQEENEITAQQEFFAAMGYGNADIGDIVTLPYRPDLKQKYEEKKFKVSGIISSAQAPVQGGGQTSYTVFLSPEFYDAQHAPGTRQYSVPFRLAEHVQITYADAKEVINEIAAACGIEEKRVSLNTGYLGLTLEAGAETMFACFVIALAVVVFSVIVIYNIFQVGVVQNIREYGKIRALGATKKQMRSLIWQEGLFLTRFSIPAGAAAGYAVSWISFHWLMEQGSSVNGEMPYIPVSIFSLPVILLSAGLALLTVLLALRKPMKIVASISPVDALRYMESTGSADAGMRKGKKQVSVLSVAAANIRADKKRTLRSVFTMGLSCVLFVILANCVGNMDAAYDARNSVSHGQFQIELTYELEDEAYPENNLDIILQNNPLNAKFIEQIKKINNVTHVQDRDILCAEINGEKQDVAVYGEEDFVKEKDKGAFIGELNYKDQTQEYPVYYGWSHFFEKNGYTQGQPLTIKLSDGAGSVTVNAVMKGSLGAADGSFIITEDLYQRLGINGKSTGWIWVDCENTDVETVRTELENLLSKTEHVEMQVYKDALEASRLGIRLIRLSCYLFLAVTGLIGFMNLANTMIMNIITKKQEYGILQAVGMTNRQLNLSLQIQGLVFSAGTVFIAAFFGLPAGYGIFRYAKSMRLFGLNVYHVPVPELFCMAAAIALLQILLTYILSRNLKKESLVERIRYQE